MKKSLLASVVILAVAGTLAWAQQFSMPPPAGVIVMGCTYQSSGQSITTGNAGFVQCNSGGQLIVGLSGSTPQGATTTTAGGSIAVTNTFQQALAANANRRSCLLQNKGSNTMYVYFGAIGSATTPLGLELSNKASVSCASFSGIVATDAVNVTGTSGDLFVVTSQ